MTPEQLSALADRIARIQACCARFYFLVPKRQQLPPVSEELEPGSVRFLGWGRPLELTFEGYDFNFIMAMRLWSLAGGMHAPFFVGGGAGGFLGSLVPIAAWLKPHLTTGYAVEVSKFFNIQPYGMQKMLAGMVASGLTMEEARAVMGGLY